MKNFSRSSIIVLFISLFLLFLAGGATNVNAQTKIKAADISAFFCSWRGYVSADSTFGADVKITPTKNPAYAIANFQTYGNALGQIITVKAMFADGEMSTSLLTFVLLEPNKLQITNNGSNVVFTLKCSR